MVRVLVSGKVLEKNVGGNTRYAREVYSRLPGYGISYAVSRPVPFPGDRLRSTRYALHEGLVVPAVSHDVDVLHFPADTGAMFGGRQPIVATVHGLATLHVANVRSRTADAVWRARVGRLVQSARTVITVSESSARDIAAAFPEAAGKLVPIHHGIDHARFRPAERRTTPQILAALGVEGPYFAYVGNLEPRKNILQLLRAAGDVFEQTGVPLVVSGAPAWGYAEIMYALQETPGVRYIGRAPEDDMVAVMQNAVAFCFPSKYEGFGFPVLEAMACGTPVICSDRGSLGEVAAEAALTITELDAKTIGDAMRTLLADDALREDLRTAGLENARRFDWNDSADAHARVFREAAGYAS